MRLAFFISLVLFSCSNPSKQARFFVASSIAPAVEEISNTSPHACEVVPGSSATLARQILDGAPADIFISANRKWMDAVIKQDPDARSSMEPLVYNRLVFVGHAERSESKDDWRAILRHFPQKVAIADLETVPLGMYTSQVLNKQFQSVDTTRFVRGNSAGHTVNLILKGEADYGIVFATDARAHKELTLYETIPAELHDPIAYYIAVLNREQELSRASLFSIKGREIFQKKGFLLKPPAGFEF
jgi:molybdate transport system substrate-binding protein